MAQILDFLGPLILFSLLILGLAVLYACTKYHMAEQRRQWQEPVRLLGDVGTVDNPVREICTVCQDSMEARQLAITLSCNHKFHLECVTSWLRRNMSCPLCRERQNHDNDHEGRVPPPPPASSSSSDSDAP